MPALARRLELVSGRIGQSDLQELDCRGLGCQVAGLKVVKSTRKLVGSMVAEHGSREFQGGAEKRQGGAHCRLDFLELTGSMFYDIYRFLSRDKFPDTPTRLYCRFFGRSLPVGDQVGESCLDRTAGF